MKQTPDSRLSKTFGGFITAFAIYKSIMCEAYPQRRQELDTYERDIVYMSTRYGGTTFYEYHKQFPSNAAALLQQRNIRVDRSKRDNKLFCSLFAGHKVLACSICQQFHAEQFCPLQAHCPDTSYTRSNFSASYRGSDQHFRFSDREGRYRENDTLGR